MGASEPGWSQGVLYACGRLAQEGQDSYAEWIFNESGADPKLASEYDVALLRKIIPGLPRGKD